MKRKSHLDGVIRLSPAIYFNQPFRNPCAAFSEWMCFFYKVNCFHMSYVEAKAKIHAVMAEFCIY
ncbi:hypothetical protein IMY05_005G0031800 [Salix suchowensis]|nr:hypothetical protein IMY05_005G0031800 [Salix suchowensis]